MYRKWVYDEMAGIRPNAHERSTAGPVFLDNKNLWDFLGASACTYACFRRSAKHKRGAF